MRRTAQNNLQHLDYLRGEREIRDAQSAHDLCQISFSVSLEVTTVFGTL